MATFIEPQNEEQKQEEEVIVDSTPEPTEPVDNSEEVVNSVDEPDPLLSA